MTKHRYANLSESVADFNRMLDDMNKVTPMEKSFADQIQELFQDEQALVRLEQQIEHVTTAIHASGMKISKTEAADVVSMHNHAASVYGQAADKAARRMDAASRSGNTAMTAKMSDIHKRLRRMAGDHQIKAKKYSESMQRGQFTEAKADLSVFRRLAGIDEVVQMPRDPGMMGTTRFNAAYDTMAKPFDKTRPKG